VHYPNLIVLAGILISLLMHLPHFSKELMSVHVWRQTQTQSTIDSFHEEDRNILNPRRNNRGDEEGIFRMEFPLMQWLIAAIYPITGRSILVTRLFMFLTGIACILGIFFLLRKLLKDAWIASLGAWAFTFSPAFYYYIINPIPDMFALALSIWGISLCWKSSGTSFIMGLILLSLGTLCKLPFVIFFIIPFFTIVPISDILQKNFNLAAIKPIATSINLLKIFLALLPPIIWYAQVVPAWKGNGIVQGLLNNQTPLSQLEDYLLHNLISTLPELLVNYASLPFFLTGIYFAYKQKLHTKHKELLFLGLALGAYFLFELNMIAKVHDYYLFPFYPIIFICVAYGIRQFIYNSRQYLRYFAYTLLLIVPLTAWLRMQTRWDIEKPGFNKDLLLYQHELRAVVPDSELCIAGNDESGYIFFYYIHKKGWAFQKDEPDIEQLKQWRNRGASYLYSDSEEIDRKAFEAGIIECLILKRESIRVYKLNHPIENVFWGGKKNIKLPG